MTALFRYTFATFLASQRFAAPVLCYFGLLTVLTSSDSGPLVSVYAACAGSLLAASTWLTVALVDVEDPVSRSVLVVNAGRSRDVLLATVAVAVVFCTVLTGFGLAYPLVSGRHTVTAGALTIGAAAQLTCAFVGIALGLLCSRLVIPRAGWSVLAGLGLVMAVLLAKWVPPVYPLLRAMGQDRSAASLAAPVLGYAACGVVALVAGVAAVQAITVRRD